MLCFSPSAAPNGFTKSANFTQSHLQILSLGVADPSRSSRLDHRFSTAFPDSPPAQTCLQRRSCLFLFRGFLYLPLGCFQSSTAFACCAYGQESVRGLPRQEIGVTDQTAIIMSNKNGLSFSQRADEHPHLLVKKLFQVAERKQTNIVLSADLTTTKELLAIADGMSIPRDPCDTCSMRSENNLRKISNMTRNRPRSAHCCAQDSHRHRLRLWS